MPTVNLPVAVTGSPIIGNLAWSNTGNITASDNVYASTTTTTYKNSDIRIGVTNTIPAGSTITSVTLSIEVRQQGVAQYDQIVYYDQAGNPVKIWNLYNVTSDTTYTQSLDTTIPAFFYLATQFGTGTVYLDYVQLQVVYTPPLITLDTLFFGNNF